MTPQIKKQKTSHAIDGEAQSSSAIGGQSSSAIGGLDFGSFGLMPTVPPAGAEPEKWETFYALLVSWARSVIPIGLKYHNIEITSVGDALPTRIKDNKEQAGGRGTLTTFRGDWDPKECVLALDTTSMYENGGVIHWLDARSGKVEFDGEVIFNEHTPWNQVVAALHTWSWARYMISSTTPGMRRFIFSVALPTAIPAAADARRTIKVMEKQAKKDVLVERPTFAGCPVLAGRAHIIALYYQMGLCMTTWTEQDRVHFMKLWEVWH